MADAEVFRIYLSLLDEGTRVWTPVDAVRLSEDTYRIVSVNPDPDDEKWEFTTSDVVRCVPMVLSRGECLVAVARVAPEQAQ